MYYSFYISRTLPLTAAGKVVDVHVVSSILLTHSFWEMKAGGEERVYERAKARGNIFPRGILCEKRKKYILGTFFSHARFSLTIKRWRHRGAIVQDPDGLGLLATGHPRMIQLRGILLRTISLSLRGTLSPSFEISFPLAAPVIFFLSREPSLILRNTIFTMRVS